MNEQKFWEKCGFRKFTDEDYRKIGGYSAWWIGKWVLPTTANTNGLIYFDKLPDIHDLNAIFRYAVPMLWEKGFWVQLLGDGTLGWDARIHHLASNDNYSIYQHTELALALAEAIEKALEEE